MKKRILIVVCGLLLLIGCKKDIIGEPESEPGFGQLIEASSDTIQNDTVVNSTIDSIVTDSVIVDAMQEEDEIEEIEVDEVTAQNVERIITYLASDELEGRNTGTEGLDKAATFIEKEFINGKVPPYFNTYKDTFSARGVETYNVVGFIEGVDKDLAKEFIIVGAHYDHIGTAREVNGDIIANGANDNAAGSTAVITLAKQFAKYKNNKRSILFVLFGAEEKGLLGSKHLAKLLKQQQLDLYTVVNFEMIGVPLSQKPYKSYITGFDKSNMSDKINEYADSKLTGFWPRTEEMQLFMRSDNYPFFQEFNVPSQSISTCDFVDFNYYHHVDDEVSVIKFDFMASLINDYFNVISKMANTPTKEIKLK